MTAPHRRPGSWALLLVAGSLWWGTGAHAGEAPGEQVRMSLDRYARLMGAGRRGGDGAVTWGRGTLTFTGPGEGERAARVQVSARVQTVGTGPIEVALLPADVVLVEAQIGGHEATLLRANGVHIALLPAGQSQMVELTYLVPVQRDASDQRYAMVPLPPLAGAALEASGVPEGSAWPAENVRRGDDSLDGSVPATPAVLIRWGGEGTGQAVRRVDYSLSLDASGDGVEVTATFHLQLRGGVTQLRLAPADTALMDVREGRGPVATRVVDEWHTLSVTGAGAHTVTARLRLPIDRTHGQPQVNLHPDGVPITRVEIAVPGKRTVSFEPPVPLETTIKGQGEAARTTAVAFLPPTEETTIRWTEARAAPETTVRVNTDTYQLLTLQEGVLRSRVVLRYDVIYGKLKELPIALPEDAVPFKVTGEGIQDWRIFPATEEEPRQLRVVLGRDLEGSAEIEVQLETSVAPVEGTALRLPLVRPLHASRELGVVALFDGDKVGFAPATAAGYTKVGQDALPVEIRQGLRDKVNQAFKHIGAPGAISSKVTTAKTREVRFDARVDTLYLVREGALTGQCSVLVEIKSGRGDHIFLSVPKDVAEPRITAPSLNKVEPAPDFDAGAGRKAFRVSFTQALEGAIQLDVEFELLLKKELGAVALPEVRVHGAEVESGSFGVAAETGMEVQPGEVSDVRKVEATELPKSVRLRSDLEVVLGYHYAHAPWKVALDIKRHRTVETLTAVGERVWLETNVLESGNLISRVAYRVANDEKQFLRLILPDEAKVLRVTVDGRKVKAVQDEAGAIAIPLPKARTSLVDVTFETRRERLGWVGTVALTAPRVDIRTSDIQWLVRLPADRPVYATSTDLRQGEAFQWRPEEEGRPDDGHTLPQDAEVTALLFTYAVHDSEEPALSVQVSFAATPGPGAEALVFLLSLALLIWVTRRRARALPLDVTHWVALGLGAGGLTVKAALWGFSLGEGLTTLVVLLVVGFMSHRAGRRPGDDTARA